MFPENFALYISQKQKDLRDFEQCFYRVKKPLSTCCSFQGYIHENSDNFQGCNCSVGPRSMDTRLIGTPVYNGQFLLSRRKADIFSLNLTRLIRTPVKTDNRHLCMSRVTYSHRQPHFTDTGYLRTEFNWIPWEYWSYLWKPIRNSEWPLKLSVEWLSHKLKAPLQSKVMDSFVVFQEKYLKGSFSLKLW